MIFEQLLLASGILASVVVIMNVLGSTIYDMRQIKQKKIVQQHPHASRYRNRPLVSVIVTSSDDGHYIKKCVKSLLRSSYRKLEIIIVDNASQDGTKQSVKSLIREYPKKYIKLYAKHVQAPRLANISAGYKKYGGGGLVLLLDAGSLIDRHTVRNAVNHFNLEDDTAVLSLNIKTRHDYRLASLFKQFEQLLLSKGQKVDSVYNSSYLMPLQNAMYTKKAFNNLFGPKAASKHDLLSLPANTQIRYASDSVVYDRPASSLYALFKSRYYLQLRRLQAVIHQRHIFFSRDNGYQKSLTWFRLPLAVIVGVAALFIPLIMAYLLYLAIKLHQPTLLVVLVGLLSIFLVFAVWDDEQLALRQKLSYCLLIPVTYGMFCVLSFVQLFVVLRSLVPVPNTNKSKPSIHT